MTDELKELPSETQEALQEYQALPNDPSKPGEKGVFCWFTDRICSLFCRNKDTPERIARAKADQAEADVAKTKAEEELFAKQACEVAARTDQINQQVVEQFNKNVEGIRMDPEIREALKRGKLLEMNPEILEQIERINTIQHELRLRHGVRVQVAEPQRLEAGERSTEDGEEND